MMMRKNVPKILPLYKILVYLSGSTEPKGKTMLEEFFKEVEELKRSVGQNG